MAEDVERGDLRHVESRPYLDYNSLHLRLNPEPLLDEFLKWLYGAETEYKTDEIGNIVPYKIKFGLPKANMLGIQAIKGIINTQINPQTVQGNFPMSEKGYSHAYEDYMCRLQGHIVGEIGVNLDRYGIDEMDYEAIVMNISNTIRVVMTRLVANKERDSYSQSVTHTESNVSKEKQGFQLFHKNQ